MPIEKKSKLEKKPEKKNGVAKARPSVKSAGAKPAAPAAATLTQTERHRRIAEAAYFIALRKGFDLSDPQQNWMEAERQVDAELSSC